MSDSAKPSCNQQVGYRKAQQHIEAVASRLDDGWETLVKLWRVAERAMSSADEGHVWLEHARDCDEADSSQAEHALKSIHEDHIAAAASLLDLCSHIKAMRRAEQ